MMTVKSPFVVVLLLLVCLTSGFLPLHQSRFTRLLRVQVSAASSSREVEAAEAQLRRALENVSGRGRTASVEVQREIEQLIGILEDAGSAQKRDDDVLEGVWRLLYTSTPGNTASPIQRSLTGFDGVAIFQVIDLKRPSFLGNGLPTVSNTVVFGEGQSRLRVTALASTLSRPLVEPRVGDGNIFGLFPFGKSVTKPARNPQERIDFAFQEAQFEFSQPFSFSIPYPVPFKLLGDEAKGYIDNTFFSSGFRIARGNKGTIFLLERANISTDKKAAAAAALRLPESSNVGSSSQPQRVAVLLPSQLGTVNDYDEFQRDFEREAGMRMFITPLERLDWPRGLVGSFFTKAFLQGKLQPRETLKFYFQKVDEAVAAALAESPEAEIVLISHSIGGWVARAWLSEWASPDIKARVRTCVSLGSPHNPPPADSSAAKVDQTRGLLSYITDNYPGAFEKKVKYVSVIGRAVQGELSTEGGGERLLAYASYSALCGTSTSEGDGIIPLQTSFLAGAQNIVVDSARHSNFIPTPFKQAIFIPGAIWYGSPEVLREWLPALKAASKK